MNLNLDDTLLYDGEELEYTREYYPNGLIRNAPVRVYSGDTYRVHYSPVEGLAKVVDGDGFDKRVVPVDEVRASGEPVELRDANT